VSRNLIDRYWKAQDPYDPKALAELRHPAWTLDWPQSGERIARHEDEVAISGHHPDYPNHELLRETGPSPRWTITPLLTPLRISGEGSLWIMEASLEYPRQGVWHNIETFELRDGLVWRETGWFAPQLDPPEWRSEWVQATEKPLRPVGVSVSEDPDAEARHRTAVERYMERRAAGDLEDAILHLYHEDAVEELPQSGERIVGLEDILAVAKHDPEPPTGRVRRLFGRGDLLVGEFELDYSGTPCFWVAIIEFAGEKAARIVGYFTEPSDPPDWRSRWVTRI